MKPVDLFSRDVHSFWATTFQFDLKLFDQFLLRRLGHEPLNAVILADEDDLTETLGQLSEVDRYVVGNANRRYLLRGMRVPSGGRFHPKTYLFASGRRTVLLVGSGNLTRSGLDRGSETFVEFDASVDEHQPVFRAWASWIGGLVDARDDEVLRRRYAHLRATLPLLVGPSDQDVFFANGTVAFSDVIARLQPEVVTELHVSAPYFDERAEALRGLIERANPTTSVHLYLGARPSVDGAALSSVLASAGVPVTVHRFAPDRFVHAKLIGLIGSEESLLVCGSANLSRAALDRVYETPGSWGNCEAIVVRSGDALAVRSVFCPPDSSLVEIEPAELTEFTYSPDDVTVSTARVRLLSAALDPAGFVTLQAKGALDRELWLKYDDESNRVVTTWDGARVLGGPMAEGADPRVVWLVDEDDTVISNVIVVDDPRALDAALGERSGERDRPGELLAEDEASDLIALLSWGHRRFIFDLDDTPAVLRARQSTESEAADGTDFWERYAREELAYDPRSQTYRPLAGIGASSETDLLLREIEAMLHAAPQDRRLRLLRGIAGGEDSAEDSGTGHSWSLTARQQLRARNVIRRWARALPDPRHAWLSPDAPARNYEALVEMLALIWLGDTLERERIVELLGEVWTGLLGSDTHRGLVQGADPELRGEVLRSINGDVRELAAAMAYVTLAEPGWVGLIYDWQPFLARGVEDGLFVAGGLACAFVQSVSGDSPTATEIEDLLLERIDYTDDERWGDRIQGELGLSRVRLVRGAQYKRASVVVEVAGMADPAHDPRTVALARRVMAFKKSDHVLIDAEGERFLLQLGSVARARLNGQAHSSTEPIEMARLDAVERQGGTLADLLGIAAA